MNSHGPGKADRVGEGRLLFPQPICCSRGVVGLQGDAEVLSAAKDRFFLVQEMDEP